MDRRHRVTEGKITCCAVPIDGERSVRRSLSGSDRGENEAHSWWWGGPPRMTSPPQTRTDKGKHEGQILFTIDPTKQPPPTDRVSMHTLSHSHAVMCFDRHRPQSSHPGQPFKAKPEELQLEPFQRVVPTQQTREIS